MLSPGGALINILEISCWSVNPGISETTQIYGSSLATTEIATDLFLVPSVLLYSTNETSSTVDELCSK